MKPDFMNQDGTDDDAIAPEPVPSRSTRRGLKVGARRRYHDRLAIAVISGHGRDAGVSRTEAAGIRRRRRELDEADKRAVAEYAVSSARLAEADAIAAERYRNELAEMIAKGKRKFAEDRMKNVSIRVL